MIRNLLSCKELCDFTVKVIYLNKQATLIVVYTPLNSSLYHSQCKHEPKNALS